MDVRIDDVMEARDDILVCSFTEGYVSTVAALGGNRSDWEWEDLHTSTFVSTTPVGMSGIGLIEGMVNQGPFATRGSTATMNNRGWDVASGDLTIRFLNEKQMPLRG